LRWFPDADLFLRAGRVYNHPIRARADSLRIAGAGVAGLLQAGQHRMASLRDISTGAPMLKKNEFMILTGLAAVGLLLAIVNMVMFGQNRQAQAEVASRAQYIQQSAQLEPLFREMAKALADLSVRNNDVELRELLAKHGVTLSTNPSPAVAAPEPKTEGN
jgi:hypothetical protein